MKKVLLTLVIGLVVAAGASYFGVQWRAEKALKEALSQLGPFVDASFEDLTIALDGRVVVTRLNFYVPMTATNINVRQAEFSTSGLLETLQLEKKIENGQLPDALAMTLRGLSVSVPRTVFTSWNQTYQPSLMDQISALGCGTKTAITPVDFYAMGLSELLLDVSVGYNYARSLDELVANMSVSIDGFGSISFAQTMLGMAGIMDNWQSAMFMGADSLSTQRIDVSFQDRGYNNRYAEYCAGLAKKPVAEWRQQNAEMADAAMRQIGLQSEFDFVEVYSQLLLPNVDLHLSMLPSPGFDATDFSVGFADFIQLAGLTARINNQQVPLQGLSYDASAVRNINLAAIRAMYLETPQTASATPSTSQAAAAQASTRRLIDVPVVTLTEYVGRDVYLVRNDSQVFAGELIAADRERALVRIRLRGGFTDIPVLNNTIREAKLYPEN